MWKKRARGSRGESHEMMPVADEEMEALLRDVKTRPIEKWKCIDDQTEALIREVKNRPTLWNNDSEDFMRPRVTMKHWTEVGANVGLSGAVAKKKWKNLKDKYRKILRLPLRTAKLGKVRNKWRFYDAMQFTRELLLANMSMDEDADNNSDNDSETNEMFIDDDCGRELTTLNNSETTDKSSIALKTEMTESNVTEKDVETALSELLSDDSVNSADHAQGVRKTARPASNSRYGQRRRQEGSIFRYEGKRNCERKTEPAKNSPHKKRKTEEDDDYHFLMSLHPFLKQLQPFEKLELRSRLLSQVMESYKTFKQESYEIPIMAETTAGTSFQFGQEQPNCLIEYHRPPDQ